MGLHGEKKWQICIIVIHFSVIDREYTWVKQHKYQAWLVEYCPQQLFSGQF